MKPSKMTRHPLSRAICGLDLGGSTLRFALVERRWGTPVVSALVQAPYDPSCPVADQIAAAVRAHHLQWDELHVGIGGEHATHRLLTLPFVRRKQLDAAVPTALTALVPFTLPDAAVGYEIVESRQEGTTVCAALTPRAALREIAEQLAAAGIEHAIVHHGPMAGAALVGALIKREAPGAESVAFLDLAARAPTLAMWLEGSLQCLRVLAPTLDEDALARELRWTLAAAGDGSISQLIVAGTSDRAERLGSSVRRFGELDVAALPTSPRTDHDAFAVALGLALGVARRGAIGGGFRPDDAHLPRGRGALHSEARRTRMLTAAVLLLFLTHAATRYAVARRALGDMESTLAARLASLSSTDGPPIRTLSDLTTRVEHLGTELTTRRGASASGLEILRELSSRIGPDVAVVVNELAMDGAALSLAGHATDFETVTELEQALARSPLFDGVTTTEASIAEAGIAFRLSLRLRGVPRLPPVAEESS